MKLTFIDPGLEYNASSIAQMVKIADSPFWLEPLFHFFPLLEKELFLSLPDGERETYIKDGIKRIYQENKEIITEKVHSYNALWKEVKNEISSAFIDVFSYHVEIFPPIEARITLDPVSPRFLDQNAFEVFYLNSPKGAIGSSLHEIIHLLWFHRWSTIFNDDTREYEKPSLKWILSEMVVESIMRDKRLASNNPYFPKEKGGCVYPYFYSMVIDGECILDTLYVLFRKNSLDSFMVKSYEYVKKHEDEIRRHIAKSEGAC